jgi:hypothetical protein
MVCQEANRTRSNKNKKGQTAKTAACPFSIPLKFLTDNYKSAMSFSILC